MSNKPMAQPKSIAKTNAARKRYAAPVLEAYGTVQELTLTTYSGSFDIADLGFYYTSSIG